MDEMLFDNTKLAAYFLWENTLADNTLQLWYCSEDVACFLEQSDILTMDQLDFITGLDVCDIGYIQFVRHIAYRIYIYTGNDDALFNWFTAERLLGNGEWKQALICMASFYNTRKSVAGGLSGIHSGKVKNFYKTGCL
ncbi:MAG: hypothetical protein LBS84_10555 [Clostridiales bacterium]|nr:hypothetical protein [Clostridiales bacterium]